MWLRIFLFAGLVIHKVIWEIWKRRNLGSNPEDLRLSQLLPKSRTKRIVKAGKVVVLIFFLVQALFLNVLPMNNPNPSIRVVGIVLFVLGLCTAIAGRISLGANWRDLEDRQVLPHQSLVTKGLYHFIRHPIYAGDMLLIVGLQLALQSWLVIFALAIVSLVIRQSLAEEKLLTHSFPGYREYCAQTKRFLPFLI